MLRPTSYLTFTLEGTDATPQTASAIKRSYSYVAPTKIVAGRRGANDAEPPLANGIALEVKLGTRPYWSSADDGADAVWAETLLPWLSRKLRTLFDTVLECNNETRRSFAGKVSYRNVAVKLAPHTVVFDLEPNSDLRDVETPLAAIRAYLNDGIEPAADQSLRFVVPSNAERGEDGDWFDVVASDGTAERIAISPATHPKAE